jgi:molecular chaperone DnaK (HSP70)
MQVHSSHMRSTNTRSVSNYTLNYTGVERAKKGEPKVEVTFTLDANGILNVTACDKVIANNHYHYTHTGSARSTQHY